MKYNDVEFSITGIINGEVETVTYRYKDGKGTIEADEMIEFLLPALFAKPIPVGPVGQYLDRDINNKTEYIFISIDELKNKFRLGKYGRLRDVRNICIFKFT